MAQTMLRDYLRQTEEAITSGHIDDALERCQHILAQFPQSLEVQRLLGETYLKQGQLDEARQTFDWVLTNDPENVVVYCDRAFISEHMSDYDTALDCYQQAYELSRGNSQIRQKFNQLSAKAGQQGFMFSRAGLARLYMRGNLLPRAIQEWETVLALSPDRLDARLGLLEACWREGFYERTELLAAQILSDVPTCLKALLILAHVVSGRDMQKSQQLIKRAETLDPELVMAQELFGDTIASQPNNPFVKVLKKPPVLLLDMASQEAASPAPAVPNGTVHLQNDAINIPAVSSDILSNWQGLDDWNGKDADIQPQKEVIAPAEESTLAWVDMLQDQQQNAHEKQQIPNTTAQATDATAQQDVLRTTDQLHLSEQQDASPLPSWLSILTHDEQSSPGGYEQSYPSENPPAQQPSFSVETPSASDRLWQDELADAPDEENEAFSFGPEWLKALGAAIMESEISEEPASAPVAEHSAQLNAPQVSTSAAQDKVLAEAQQAARMADQPEQEQDFITMLESLERDLRSQGFVPMEPNSLTTIAQQEIPNIPTYDASQSDAEMSQEPTLSSALARLGNLSPQSQGLPEPPTSLPEPHQEPLATTPSQAAVSSVFTSSISQASPIPPSLYHNMSPDVAPSATHQPSPVQTTTAESSKIGVTQYDEQWDELEATMKRPAVRLPSKTTERPAEMPSAGKRTTEKLSVDANNSLTYRQRLVKGYQHQLLGDYDEAMQEYRVVIPVAPELLAEVVSNVRALLKISPKYAAGYRVLGDAYMRLGEYLQAMEAYNKALAMAKRVKSSQNQ